MLYLGIIIVTMILGGIGQFAVKSAYSKWGNIASAVPITGQEMAVAMLNAAGEQNVIVNVVPGTLTDYFDPKNKTLNLSQDVAYGTSVAAHAVACHEAGHYLQFTQGYALMKLRHLLVPITNFASQISWILIVIGMMMSFVGLVNIGVICYASSLVFALVTLPVELNASKRAIKFLDGGADCTLDFLRNVPANEKQGTRTMLRAAASTYVMSVLASALNLLYVLFMTQGSRK